MGKHWEVIVIWENTGKMMGTWWENKLIRSEKMSWVCFLTPLRGGTFLVGTSDSMEKIEDKIDIGYMQRFQFCGEYNPELQRYCHWATVDNHDNEYSVGCEPRKQYCVVSKLQQSTLFCMVLPFWIKFHHESGWKVVWHCSTANFLKNHSKVLQKAARTWLLPLPFPLRKVLLVPLII